MKKDKKKALEQARKLWALAHHPQTPGAERQLAQMMLQKRIDEYGFTEADLSSGPSSAPAPAPEHSTWPAAQEWEQWTSDLFAEALEMLWDMVMEDATKGTFGAGIAGVLEALDGLGGPGSHTLKSLLRQVVVTKLPALLKEKS